jgi:hypothetical protein
MNIIRRLLRQDPPVEDPNTDLTDGDGDLYTLELAAILRRLDMDDEDDTANFNLIEGEYDCE